MTCCETDLFLIKFYRALTRGETVDRRGPAVSPAQLSPDSSVLGARAAPAPAPGPPAPARPGARRDVPPAERDPLGTAEALSLRPPLRPPVPPCAPRVLGAAQDPRAPRAWPRVTAKG